MCEAGLVWANTPGRWRVVAHLWIAAALLRVLKHVVPLPRLVRWASRFAWRNPPETAIQLLLDQMRRPGKPAFRIPANCLERSLAVYHLLCRTSAAPHVVVGMRKGGVPALHGHVWLSVNGQPLWDSPAWLSDYTAVVAFDESAHAYRPSRGSRCPGPDSLTGSSHG